MAVEKENSVVAIEYEVKEVGGTDIIDSNKGGHPLEFITGKGQIIPGLESALVGMSKGESGDFKIDAADAYGAFDPEAVQVIPRDQFEGIDLEEGMVLYGQGEGGQTVQVTVKSFTDEDVTIDYNHPLAGKDLLFTVTLLDEREATVDEVMTGQVGGMDSECCSTHGGCGCH